jgi:hypothetical protein
MDSGGETETDVDEVFAPTVVPRLQDAVLEIDKILAWRYIGAAANVLKDLQSKPTLAAAVQAALPPPKPAHLLSSKKGSARLSLVPPKVLEKEYLVLYKVSRRLRCQGCGCTS